MRLMRMLLMSAVLTTPVACQAPETPQESRVARYLEYMQQPKSLGADQGDFRKLLAADFTNGGFETGDFSGWGVGESGSPLEPWSICAFSSCGFFFNNEPIEGDLDALNGFDGAAGYEAFLFQDIDVPAGGGSIQLADRIQFDSLGILSTLPRVYELQLRDLNNNLVEILHHEEILLNGQPYTDLGWRQRSFDISAHAGEAVRLYVQLSVPEDFTGPAQFELDDVRFIPGGGGGGELGCELALEGVPAPATVGDPFVLEMDLLNLGAAFDAQIAVLLLADGKVSTLDTASDVALSAGFAIDDFPVFATLALAPMPPSIGLMVVIFDEASRGLICSNVAIVGVGAEVSADDIAAIHQLAETHLATARQAGF